MRRRAGSGIAALVLAVAPGLACAVAAPLKAMAPGSFAASSARSEAAVGAGAPPACSQPRGTPGRWMPESQGWRAVVVARPNSIPVGRHFALEVALCPPPGQTVPAGLKVDADMPAHRHGMNYRPLAVPVGAGRFRVDGLMFHMPGRWRLWLEFESGQGTRRLEQALDVR